LESAIKELSVKCRTALLLNRLEGKTHAEIARTLGVSESMVAKYIVQALKHCRARLQEEP
jgi:RNA polymerase sigma-70 factor (ECF subfamily)